MTPQEILLKAADYYDRLGWCQKAMSIKDGRRSSVRVWEYPDEVCLIGAIFYAAIEIKDANLALGAIEKACGSKAASWNDTPGRTKEEVVAKLREAAEL